MNICNVKTSCGLECVSVLYTHYHFYDYIHLAGEISLYLLCAIGVSEALLTLQRVWWRTNVIFDIDENAFYELECQKYSRMTKCFLCKLW